MYERYCKLRDLNGYKDADVAKITEITKSTFTDWKNGKSKPNADKLLLIAKCLGTTVEYLMTGQDDRLSERNADVDFMLLTDDDSRGVLIEYKTLDKDHKEMLKKYLELLKKDMK